jgi:AraC-like DNA-binding protein
MASLLTEVQRQLSEEGGLRLSAAQMAKRLYCSERTLYRKLSAAGTSLVSERNAARVAAALAHLKNGYSVEQAARRVGLSADYLRVVMQEALGITPEKVKQIVRVSARLEKEPESRSELARTKLDDQLLQELIGDIGPTHPLYRWAKEIVLLGHKPERDSAAYKKKLREKELAAFRRRQDEVDATAVAALELEVLGDLDVDSLLSQREHREEHMRWRANQRRRREPALGRV